MDSADSSGDRRPRTASDRLNCMANNHQPYKVVDGMMVCEAGCTCLCCRLEQQSRDIMSGCAPSRSWRFSYTSDGELRSIAAESKKELSDDSHKERRVVNSTDMSSPSLYVAQDGHNRFMDSVKVQEGQRDSPRRSPRFGFAHPGGIKKDDTDT